MGRIATIVVGIAAALVLATGGAAQFAGSNGDIYFTGSPAGAGPPNHVYSVAPDGTGLAQRTFGDGDDEAVRVAPGGSRLLVSRDTHEQCGHLYWAQGVDLFLQPSGGGAATRLTDDCPADESTPAWSPSGAHVVFSRFGQLWSMRADGTGLVALTCPASPTDYAPDWSPDGSRIAFARGLDVYVMRADGGDPQLVGPGVTPSFSPGGSLLAFAGVAPGAAQGIYTSGLDGSGRRQLTSGYDLDPVWSPDGSRIAFIHVASIDEPQSFEIETMQTDGSDVRIVERTVTAHSLDWAGAAAPAGVQEPDATSGETACSRPAAAEPPPSPATAPVTAPAFRAAERLSVAQVRFTPAVLRSRRPFTVTVLVRDRSGRPVPGALVRAVALRGRARPLAGRAAGPDGRAVLRLVPTTRQPAGKHRLVLELRARRPGETWTSARSAHRLVSVRTPLPPVP